MKYSDCEANIKIEDWMDDKPFSCPHYGIIVQLITNEGGYSGAN